MFRTSLQLVTFEAGKPGQVMPSQISRFVIVDKFDE
jgi:hypothetical protein